MLDRSHVPEIVLEEPEKEQVALLGFNPDRVSLAGAKAAIAAWERREFTVKWLEAMAVHFTRKLRSPR